MLDLKYLRISWIAILSNGQLFIPRVRCFCVFLAEVKLFCFHLQDLLVASIFKHRIQDHRLYLISKHVNKS